jgi:hypothetical protein
MKKKKKPKKKQSFSRERRRIMFAKKKCLLVIGIIAMVTFLLAAGIQAVATVQDVIRLETTAYENHKEPVVVFSHREHQEKYTQTYPEFFKAGCGECHHDKNNKPLKNLKAGDDVKKCIEYHQKASYVKAKKAKGLSKKQKLEYHANALHENCKDCHREVNKKTAKKTAPVTCKSCHLKS